MRGWGKWGFGLIVILLLTPGVFGQSGSFTNDSPSPMGGFTSFQAVCPEEGAFQTLVVCDSLPCSRTTSSLCTSGGSLSPILSCSGPATPAHLGWAPVYGACCNLATGTCAPLPNSSRVVGFEQYLVSGGTMVLPDQDFRQSKVIHLGSGSLLVAYETTQGAMLRRTDDGGASFSPPFPLSTLITKDALPANLELGSVTPRHPALARTPNGNSHLVFSLVDNTNGKSAIYYSQCPSSRACTSGSDWSKAISIVNPLVATENGRWRYSFSQPKLVVRGDALHVMFDDAQSNLVTRLQGIFHYACAAFADCTATHVNWIPPSDGPDILVGGGNGNPRSPTLALSSDGALVAGWVDYPVPGGVGSTMLYFAQFDPAANEWTIPHAILPASGNFVEPILDFGGGVWFMGARQGNNAVGWECASNCTRTIWNGVAQAYGEGLEEVAIHGLVTHPNSRTRLHLLTGKPSDRNPMSIFASLDGQNTVISPRSISGPDAQALILTGLSDGMTASSGDETFFFTAHRDGIAYLYSSDALDETNVQPRVTVTHPASPAQWVRPGDITTTYNENVSFLAQDGDSEEGYVSIFLSPNPGELTYPLIEHAPLSHWQNSGGLGICAGTDFSISQPCRVDVTLYAPSSGAVAPDGEYYVVMRLQDSDGGESIDSSANPIRLDVSALSLQVHDPLPNSSWGGTNPHSFRMSLFDSSFAGTLDVMVAFFSPDGHPFELASFPVADHRGVKTGCTGTRSLYSCTIPFTPSPDLKEGKYDLVVTAREDGRENAVQLLEDVVLDYIGPEIVNPFPSGVIESPVTSLSFTLTDFSIPQLQTVRMGGSALSSSCVEGGGDKPSILCTIPLSTPTTGGELVVETMDGLGNERTHTFSFSLPGGSVTTPPPSERPIFSGVFRFDEEGNLVLVGTPLYIPRTVVDAIFGGIRALVLFTSNLIAIAGPMAFAIFIAFCALAGIGSDNLYRQVHQQGVIPFSQQQRERVIRTVLAGIFMGLPLFIGLFLSLAMGFIFAIIEFAGFIGATYLVKMLQYWEHVGYAKIVPPKNAFNRRSGD
ncbi:MAG: hypothetical protein Q8P05_01590 [Candidatus Diapherotrites archaeon]|nr:hypothetical protein [Candidatus Diapherotrites archaeon]MDZ4256267.1 hypothetical protein [archaeon]